MSALRPFMTGIADALRAKKKTTEPIPAASFAGEIEGLAGKMELIDDAGKTYEVESIGAERIWKVPEVMWTVPIGSSSYSHCGVDGGGNIVIISYEGTTAFMRKYDITKKLLWQVNVATPIDGSPIYIAKDGSIFIEDGWNITKYTASGVKVFTSNAPDEYIKNPQYRAAYNEDEGYLYYTCWKQYYEDRLVKVSMSTGSVASYTTETISDRSAWAICTAAGKVYYFMGHDLICVNSKTLGVIWTAATSETYPASSMAVVDNRLYCYAFDGMSIRSLFNGGLIRKKNNITSTDTPSEVIVDMQSKAIYKIEPIKLNNDIYQSILIKLDLDLEAIFAYTLDGRWLPRTLSSNGNIMAIASITGTAMVLKDEAFLKPVATLKPTT